MTCRCSADNALCAGTGNHVMKATPCCDATGHSCVAWGDEWSVCRKAGEEKCSATGEQCAGTGGSSMKEKVRQLPPPLPPFRIQTHHTAAALSGLVPLPKAVELAGGLLRRLRAATCGHVLLHAACRRAAPRLTSASSSTSSTRSATLPPPRPSRLPWCKTRARGWRAAVRLRRRSRPKQALQAAHRRAVVAAALTRCHVPPASRAQCTSRALLPLKEVRRSKWISSPAPEVHPA